MDQPFWVLGIIQLVNIGLMRYVGKNFITQPDWNVPALFRNPLIARLLVIGTQVLFVVLIVLAFFLSKSPWWFLGASVGLFFAFSAPPYGR
jgi:hypothetical protein